MSDRDRIAAVAVEHWSMYGNECSCGWRYDFEHDDADSFEQHLADMLIAAGFRGGGGCERFPVTVESRCRAIEVTRRGHLSAGHMVDAIIAALRDDSQ